MEYNLLSGAICTVNLTEGNVDMPWNSLRDIVEYKGVSTFELNENDTLVLDFDLGKRINIDRVEYEFETPYVESFAVASGIKFSCKNESFDTEYVSLVTFISTEDNKYCATVSGIWAPRYIRAEHNMSATYGVTTITGLACGFQVVNNEDVVNFGETGELDQVSVEVARGGYTDIKSIPIFNSGAKLADALINIEPTFTGLDDVISVSNSPNGPWAYPLDSDINVFKYDTFSYGKYTTTQSPYSNIQITCWEDRNGNSTSKYESGTYLTRIFRDDSNDGMRLVIDRITPQVGRIAVDRDDITETIEVRSTNTPPKDYAVFRELYSWGTSTIYYGYRDRWSLTNELKKESNNSIFTTSGYNTLDRYQIIQDSDTERWVGWATTYGTSYRAKAELMLFNVSGSIEKTKRLCYQSANGAYKINVSWQEIKLDCEGGIWVYLFCQGYSSSYWVNKTGYYLAHFDNDLNETFKWFNQSKQIQDLDVDYAFFSVWYTRPEFNTIYKLAVNGATLVNYVNASGGITHDLQGIAVLPNQQGIWFGNDGSLHRLSDSGLLLSEFTIEGVAGGHINGIALDGDGSERLWILDGSTLGLFWITGSKKGTYDFRVTLNYPLKLEATRAGCWVYCIDLEFPGKTYIKFISKENRREESSYSPVGASRPGPLELTYEHSTYIEKLPLSIDEHWSWLEWKKVAIEGYLSPEDRYYQALITLRRQEPVDKYDFVTDIDKNYFTRDQFNQDDSKPDELLWSDWRDKDIDDGLSRVYVDTTNKELIMVPDWSGTKNSYIKTSSRVVTAKNSNNKIEVRVSYRFGEGNTGLATGRNEYLYLYGYAMDENKDGNCIGARLYIPSDPSTVQCECSAKVSSYSTGGWYTNFLGYGQYDYYEGTLRIYADTSVSLRGQVAKGTSTSFVGGTSYYWESNGTRWYWEIVTNKNSSIVAITDFWIRQGDNYFYIEGPKITSMDTQELVKVAGIYPNSYKNAYLKTKAPNDAELNSNYETDLKVRWRTPVY